MFHCSLYNWNNYVIFLIVTPSYICLLKGGCIPKGRKNFPNIAWISRLSWNSNDYCPGNRPRERLRPGRYRGRWGNPWGFESPLRHHADYKRDFGLPPKSLFSWKRTEWLISGSQVWTALPWPANGDTPTGGSSSTFLFILPSCAASSWLSFFSCHSHFRRHAIHPKMRRHPFKANSWSGSLRSRANAGTLSQRTIPLWTSTMRIE